ncbi:hypothetical protein MMC09_006934 [Bachmanniomyces sp. S44760]|nr:hypothetical protein [Bachmanniomyces sp. S44760]
MSGQSGSRRKMKDDQRRLQELRSVLHVTEREYYAMEKRHAELVKDKEHDAILKGNQKYQNGKNVSNVKHQDMRVRELCHELTKTYYHYFNLENRPSAKLFRVEADKEDEFTRTNCIQCRYSYYPENMGSTECNGKEPCNNCLRRGNDKCTFVRGHDLIRCYINETRPKIERFKQRLLLLDEDAEDCEEKDLDKDIELISDGDQDLNDLIDSSLSSSKRKLQSFAQEDDKGGVLSKKSRVQLIVNELEPVTRA